MRKLASIQRVWETHPIEGADAIEAIKVMGWECVAKKGEFAPGDLCVYFEVDAFLPADDERFEFLRKSSLRKNEILGEGLRIKTVKLRGQLSQGLAMPLELFPELAGAGLGDDATEALRVRKWEVLEYATSAGTALGGKPHGIPTTDEVRIQSMPELLDAMRGKPYYVTTKMDGTSMTVYAKDGAVGVCSRNLELKDDGQSSFWAAADRFGLREKLPALGRDIALQGELCGPGIQKNRLKLQRPAWYLFDAYDLAASRYLGYRELADLAAGLGLETVPLEREGESFGFAQDELLEMAKGKYPSGEHKEGIVVRAADNGYDAALGSRLSFKVLNNDFLLKEKD